MSYFEDGYPHFSYPLEEGDEPGFRRAQLGAIHAAAAHFANRTEPGMITMPTGSGKTAVLIATAFVLRAKRVLIITPSRLVREQIADEVRTLAKLKEIGAIPESYACPTVFSTTRRVASSADWEAMREFDVVVATVQSASPEFEGIPPPPADLFDLVLVDEAHHSPARTWQALLNHFPDARRLLFTATPFRQDQKEIKCRFTFTYDLRQAFDDGVFGEISFVPVIPTEDEGHDEAIARATEAQLKADQAAGFQHRVMVRTDTRPRADELLGVYERTTDLRLSLVTGNHSLRHVRRVLAQMESGELDGVVCVNMMGEGFNFPSLKIAAVHAPHKSLSVTLQFIGRFARTGGEHVGPATFLAVPSDIEIETERLYDTRAVWQEIVQNLSAARVNQEADAREMLESFNAVDVAPDLSDLSLYVLEPYYHVKVYQLDGPLNIEEQIDFPANLQVVYEAISPAHNAAVYITRQVGMPRWTVDDRLASVAYDLFVFYCDPATNLLFVCASKRSPGLYEQLMEPLSDLEPKPLPLVRLNKALNDLSAPEFFNVGMRNRVASNTMESYRIITGSNADRAILKSDSRLYHRGHVFGRATEDGEAVTIGLSSASKIWSNKSSKLPELIEWCAKLAERISSDRVPLTGSGLDYLEVGEELSELPPGVIAADWPATVYRNPPTARFQTAAGEERRRPVIDFELAVVRDESTDTVLMVELSYDELRYRFTYSFETDRFFEPASATEPIMTIEHEHGTIPLIDFLNDEMLLFYTDDLSLIDRYDIFRAQADSVPPLDLGALQPSAWPGVNIQREFGDAGPGLQSVHAFLESELGTSDAAVVYYDHGTGEIADFVGFAMQGDRLLISFYHCKGATAPNPGHRLADISEVATQVVKSVIWASKRRIFKNIRRRFTDQVGSHRFVKGNLDELETLLDNMAPASIDFEFVAVQPGLQKEGLPQELANVLAAASDHLVRGSFKALRVMCS